MESTDLIILIFGLIFKLYYFKNKEGLESLSYNSDLDSLPINFDYGKQNLPFQKNLVDEILPVKLKEKLSRKNGIIDYQDQALKTMNIVNYYPQEVYTGKIMDKNIPYNVENHDYKFEKNPNNVINEMKEKGEELELRKIYNSTVKDYKKINPKIKNKLDSVPINNFTVFNNENINIIDEEIKPLNSISTDGCFSAY